MANKTIRAITTATRTAIMKIKEKNLTKFANALPTMFASDQSSHSPQNLQWFLPPIGVQLFWWAQEGGSSGLTASRLKAGAPCVSNLPWQDEQTQNIPSHLKVTRFPQAGHLSVVSSPYWSTTKLDTGMPFLKTMLFCKSMAMFTS
jgi:hypothetical protein